MDPMKIAQPGEKPVLLAFIASGTILIFFLALLSIGGAANWATVMAGLLALLTLVASGLLFYFYRDPDRTTPENPGMIYAPGDGRVLSVEQEREGGGKTVRIFLSVFDVHVQRLPCSGRVQAIEYHKGAFKAAMAAAARENERLALTIIPDGRSEPVVVEQIAGLLARRIECWMKEGAGGQAGDRYGIIHFGSQVAVHLPPSAAPTVIPGVRVSAGVTPIAQWR